MKRISEGHSPHVVSMLGCVTTQEPTMSGDRVRSMWRPPFLLERQPQNGKQPQCREPALSLKDVIYHNNDKNYDNINIIVWLV